MPVILFILLFKLALAKTFGLLGFSAILIAASKNFLSVSKFLIATREDPPLNIVLATVTGSVNAEATNPMKVNIGAVPDGLGRFLLLMAKAELTVPNFWILSKVSLSNCPRLDI